MSRTDQQAERMGRLRRLTSNPHRGVSGKSMLAFLKGDIVRLAEEIARTHDDPQVRITAAELAAEARRINR